MPAAAHKMRSWLFAPGDSQRKMAKAISSLADRIILDLEDAVAITGKAEARRMVADVLGALGDGRGRAWVRINPLGSGLAEQDLAVIMPAGPGGIMLPKAESGADMAALDALLTPLEEAHGIAPGTTKVLPLVTETAAAMFGTGTYRGAARLAGMTWGAEDLADSIGALSNTDSQGRYRPTYELARSLCLLGAAAAGVPAIETIMGDFRDLAGLEARAELVRRDGFRGMLAIHPDQVAVINEAFTPSAEEAAEAREIVRLFAANPGAGTLAGPKGMLDRPHLSRAEQLLAQLDD
ncbi:HpcH/HpaI aldolase/citrate lyase family protein [Qipengyuania sediminis]|uniref:HpcH/HpaI aldolase/citrate lyase family protein n=1 Tax=Qipengyuania sediminis TaxID=1532023 RepID=UPI00105A4291|nr:CoA ester lyase [Qipengyuania sediminis]